jgi:hypothetical protein
MSKLDDVIQILFSRWSALPALTGVMVFNGPPVGDPASGDYLFIGDDSDPESESISTFEQTWVDLACTRRSETGEVVCAVVSDSGSTDMAARQTRAFTLLAACESDLLADRTLGGTVYTASMDIGQSKPIQNSSGAASVVPFSVRYYASV